jgi:hypothetical protein
MKLKEDGLVRAAFSVPTCSLIRYRLSVDSVKFMANDAEQSIGL